ncbi:MAG: NAD-dependent protein deacylase, partial [Oligoflexales bacterium]|nr:NAD-dependent protein deacylase [Oligoflexales bacterium]
MGKNGKKPRMVILTGAGISAESGIRTFRDQNGLWEDHSIEDVATPYGFQKNPALVYRFYNERRRQARTCSPNRGHETLAKLENLLPDH